MRRRGMWRILGLWNNNQTVQTVRLFFVENSVLDEVRWTLGSQTAGDGGEDGTVYFQENNGMDIREAQLGGDSRWTLTDYRIEK